MNHPSPLQFLSEQRGASGVSEPLGVTVLVSGATGYIGGQIVPRLLELGYRVRCLVRDQSRLSDRLWRDQVEVVTGDVRQPESVARAMQGVRIAYYLVHSMKAGGDYDERDVEAATVFAGAAEQAGVERIIYLGGLAHAADGATLSTHLRSRLATGEALRSSTVPVTEFRASVIVGAGSLSFEIIRHLVERLPVMICPRWVYTRCQPIGIRDVVQYLTAAPAVEASTGEIIEIGADVITYGEMMTQYAEERGLRRWLIPVPVLTPRLSSYWVNLVTPIPSAIARPLIEGLRNESVVRDDRAQRLFPNVKPASYRQSLRWALSSDEGTRAGTVRERRQRVVSAEPARVFRVVQSLGGQEGWLHMNWAWQLRGAIDRLFGGVGLRRGRRHPIELIDGDVLDFWRVEAIEPGRMLRLRAEMRLPGEAWLQFDVEPSDSGGTTLSQTAVFVPRGMLGWMYWCGLRPVHGLIFTGMIDAIAARANRAQLPA